MVAAIENVKREECTGCFACYNVCKSNALKMELDEEGFYYPVIDIGICSSCGACLRVCHTQKESQQNETPIGISSAYAKDPKIRNAGSSGGTFPLLAKGVIHDGGIVFGAAFNEEMREVVHTSTLHTPLEKLFRSKYVQSKMGNSLRQVRELLVSGKTVLFCGTPCQVKGLISFLGKEYENLYTVDFMCHGVPSTAFFRDTIEYYEHKENAKVVDFTFREKDIGWREQIVKVYLDNGKVLKRRSGYYYYYYAFIHNMTIRQSCMNCNGYHTHLSDITLADNWGIRGDDNKGASLIIVNSIKGNQLLEKIKDNMSVVDYSDSFWGYEPYRHDYDDQARRRFFDYYKANGYNKTVSIFLKRYLYKNELKRLIQKIKRKALSTLRR